MAPEPPSGPEEPAPLVGSLSEIPAPVFKYPTGAIEVPVLVITEDQLASMLNYGKEIAESLALAFGFLGCFVTCLTTLLCIIITANTAMMNHPLIFALLVIATIVSILASLYAFYSWTERKKMIPPIMKRIESQQQAHR